jgi:phospholipase/carboxylesterase
LEVGDFSLLAPQATNNTWYPYSFLVPTSQNEPWLSSALHLLGELVEELLGKGIPKEHIYFCGFSQGACLALEFVTSNADRFGGVAAFSGGLIGEEVKPEDYQGDFKGTPIFIGTSDPDPHIPVQRFYATIEILEAMNADLDRKVYDQMGHTINQDEIDRANSHVFQPSKSK